MAEIGSVLSGRYRLMELLGQGGMATIYRANDSQLGRDVAVKLLRPEYGRDPDFGERFRHEAQAVASLNHPNIVSVFDYGQDAAGPFIVMELVDGEDLASVIRRTGPLPPRQAARIAAEVARALAAAHTRGIVHRDVKPGNVLLARDGRVKVTDFGIARAIAEAQMTLPGTTLGSVHYFSPEQARGEPTTERSDTYSLGIVLYELLTGRRPWEGDSAASIALARLSGPVPSPSDTRSGIPPALDQITQRALALDPGERFESAGAMAEALEAYLADRGQAAAATSGVAAAAGVAGTGPVAATGPASVAPLATAGGTVVSGVARPNPGSRIPYSDDAYARGGAGGPGGTVSRRTMARRLEERDEEEDSGIGPWVWVSGLLGLAILAVIAFLIFRFMSGSAATGQLITVPNFVDKQFAEAQALAQQSGLQVVQAQNVQDLNKLEGTVTAQDPAADSQVSPGSTVKLTVVTGKPLVLVPNVIGQTEQAAIVLLTQSNLAVGTRTEAFDPAVPSGSIVSQQPTPGVSVAAQTPVSYVVSKGPEPSPSPSPSLSPSPSPLPSPTPTPTPKPSPTPTPTPKPSSTPPPPSPSPSPAPT